MTSRVKLLLAVLGVILLFWLLGGLGSDDPPAETTGPRSIATGSGERVPASRVRRGGRAPAEPVRQVVELRSADLERVPADYTPGRDPFRFRAPPPPPPTPRVEPRRPEPRPEPRETVELTPPTPPKPRPPEVTVRYLGSFGPNNQKIAVFTDGETTYNAQVGDVLDGKFRVARIGYESADLSFIGFPDEPPARLPAGGR